ncbi:uncharacterized protein [Rutidosis leptorrhynchoides]|uniref:uncharacterized protein n=1 Tax=Rutidosis leptorrhynchoides TaxID=125765 RepID=UPI003A9A4C11
MNILSVNIRGFKQDGKEDWFKRMVSSSSPVVAAIQETKCKYANNQWIEFLWGSQDVGYAFKQSNGKSGGLLLVWDSNVFVVDQAVEGEFFLAIKGKLYEYDTEIVVVNVYRPHNDAKKKRFWSSLYDLLRFDNVARVLCGDFNEVRFDSKRKNIVFIDSRASRFNKFILYNGLLEIQLLGKKVYTHL